MENKKKYNDLCKEALNIFNKLGYHLTLRNTTKPYYIGLEEGKVYRVIGRTKLKMMKDGSTKKRYGSLKLRFDNGFKNIRVHRLVGDFIPNPKNKKIIDHIENDRSKNGINDLRWATQKENLQAYWQEQREPKKKEEKNEHE